MMLIGMILMPFFLVYLFISLKFIWGKEGKDERGQKIINTATLTSSPILPIGWLLLELYMDFIGKVSYQTYRDTIWLLIITTFIVQGLSITINKRKM